MYGLFTSIWLRFMETVGMCHTWILYEPIWYIYIYTLEVVEPPKVLAQIGWLPKWDDKPVLEKVVKLVNQPLKTCWPRTSRV